MNMLSVNMLYVLMVMCAFASLSHSVALNNSNSNSQKISDNSTEDSNELALDEQVQLLSKQLSALMTRRREDYKMLENSLKKYVRKNSAQFTDTADVRAELEQLRYLLRFPSPFNPCPCLVHMMFL